MRRAVIELPLIAHRKVICIGQIKRNQYGHICEMDLSAIRHLRDGTRPPNISLDGAVEAPESSANGLPPRIAARGPLGVMWGLVGRP